MDVKDWIEKRRYSCVPWAMQPSADVPVAVSTRIRVARNFAGLPFPSKASPSEREEILNKAAGSVSSKTVVAQLKDLNALGRLFLLERRLATSRMLRPGDEFIASLFPPTEWCSVLVNEEDHVRLQVIEPGFQVHFVYDRAYDILAKTKEEFATHEKYGYLTSHVNNMGTGVRMSVMVHIPAICLSGRLDEVTKVIHRQGCILRGVFGEGSAPTGYFFQVSNALGYGKDPGEIRDNIAKVVKDLIIAEKDGRRLLPKSKDFIRVKDIVIRSHAALMHSRLINHEEVMMCISMVLLGIETGIIKNLYKNGVRDLYTLIFKSQSAHLQIRSGKEAESDLQINEMRSKYVRSFLKEEAGI
jgi:protein arginine kinase